MLPNYIENSKSFEMLTRDMRLRLGETSPMKPKPYQHDNPITYMLSSSSGEDAKGKESEEEEEEANATEIDDEEKNSDCVQTPKNPNHPDNVETQIMVFGSGHSGYWSLDSKEESQLEVLKEGPLPEVPGEGTSGSCIAGSGEDSNRKRKHEEIRKGRAFVETKFQKQDGDEVVDGEDDEATKYFEKEDLEAVKVDEVKDAEKEGTSEAKQSKTKVQEIEEKSQDEKQNEVEVVSEKQEPEAQKAQDEQNEDKGIQEQKDKQKEENEDLKSEDDEEHTKRGTFQESI